MRANRGRGAGGAPGPLAQLALGPGSPLFGGAVRRGPAGRPAVALTFDDGPSVATPALLDLLDRLGVRATFFLLGANARRLGPIAGLVARRGHEIASHGDAHEPLHFRSRASIREELGRAQSSIAEAAGVRPQFYRPAFGVRWFGAADAQRELGLREVTWTQTGADWRLSADAVVERLLAAAEPGAILCLHDARQLEPSPDIGATLAAVGRLVPMLRDRGLAVEALGDLLGGGGRPRGA